jgi:hypothetical protein
VEARKAVSIVTAALKDVKSLIGAVLDGDVLAALELAQLYRVESVAELLGVVCPEGGPSVKAFDACADGFSLKRWKESK